MSAPPPSQSLLDNPLVSEWLDFGRDGIVRLRTGKVEIGQGILTALVQIAADELDVAPERIEVVSGDTRQGPVEAATTSSLSIQVGGSAVRLAASAARRLLLAEAGKLLQSEARALVVEDGLVHVDGRASDLTYWSLAGDVDLGVPAAEHAAPKAVADRRLVGISLPRIDLGEKAAGPAFVHDLVLEGMLHGRVLQPPSPWRRLAEIDTDALANLADGVEIVRDGSFLGVIAEREDVAARAIARAGELAVWTPGESAPADPVAAIAATDAAPEVIHVAGDAGSAEGRRIATTVSRPFIAHASAAPSCAVATWRDERLEVRCHSQAIYGVRDALAVVFGLGPEAVDVIHMPGAGCYGHNGQDDVTLDAALLARAVPGRPVRVLWSRADEFAVAPMGPAMVTRAEATVDAAGRIQALTVDVASQPHVRRPGRGGTVNMLAAERLDSPFPSATPDDVPVERGGGADRNAVPLYAIPNLHVAKRIVRDLPYRTSSLRGLGAFTNVFALETLMDDVAAEIGADPVALRLDHLNDARARAVIERAAAACGWPGEQEDGAGLGLGFAQYKNRSAYCAVAARVELDRDVRITHAWAAVDAGEAINPDGIANQIEGGIVQAASWTLKEALRFEGDAVVTRDWESYPILRFSEAPEIAVEVIDRPEDPALGVGEASLGPTAAAIGNAVFHGLGVRVRDLPITRDAIAAAIG